MPLVAAPGVAIRHSLSHFAGRRKVTAANEPPFLIGNIRITRTINSHDNIIA